MLGGNFSSKRSAPRVNITVYFIYPMDVIFVSWGQIGQRRTNAHFQSEAGHWRKLKPNRISCKFLALQWPLTALVQQGTAFTF
jgi:hypothetical protein